MRFDKVIWTLLAMFLFVGWDRGSAQPPQDTEQFQAMDGCSPIPPPRCY